MEVHIKCEVLNRAIVDSVRKWWVFDIHSILQGYGHWINKGRIEHSPPLWVYGILLWLNWLYCLAEFDCSETPSWESIVWYSVSSVVMGSPGRVWKAIFNWLSWFSSIIYLEYLSLVLLSIESLFFLHFKIDLWLVADRFLLIRFLNFMSKLSVSSFWEQSFHAFFPKFENIGELLETSLTKSWLF